MVVRCCTYQSSRHPDGYGAVECDIANAANPEESGVSGRHGRYGFISCRIIDSRIFANGWFASSARLIYAVTAEVCMRDHGAEAASSAGMKG
jgi:hypothetical protein